MAIAAAQTWMVRKAGNELNGGGWDSTVSSPGTNRADQDAAQVTFNGTTVTGTTSGVSANVVITGVATDGTEVGNTLRIASGTNFTAGYYTIVSVSTGISGVGAWTLDRNCSSGIASAMVGRMGGGHATLVNYSNGGSGLATPALTTPLAPGHTVYIRSAGSAADPSIGGTADYDHSAGWWTFPAGNAGTGYITFIGLGAAEAIPARGVAPLYRPLIKTCGLLWFGGDTNAWWRVLNLKTFAGASPTFVQYGTVGGAGSSLVQWHIHDANGVAISGSVGVFSSGTTVSYNTVVNNWLKNTGTTTAGSSQAAFGFPGGVGWIVKDNIVTDARGPGYDMTAGFGNTIQGNIAVNCGAAGFIVDGVSSASSVVENNTAYNCAGDAFSITVAGLPNAVIRNNTASKIPSGKFAFKVASGTAAANELLKRYFDYNNAYLDGGAGGLYSGINAGPHDTNVDPAFTDPTSATYNFGVGANLASIGIGQVSLASGDATVSYVDIGAAQRVASAGSAGMLFIPDMAAT